MSTFTLNLFLSVGLAALLGELSLVNLLAGYVVSYLCIAWLVRTEDARRYVRRAPRLLRFFILYAWDLIISGAHVAWDVLTPAAKHRPGVIAMPLDVQNDAEIVLLANLLTFSPGSLALDVSPDRKTMYVHEMFVRHPKQAKAALKRRFERLVLEVMR